MHIAVLGGGALGTSLANLLGRQEHQVRLWVRDGRQAADMRSTRQNKRHLAGVPLPNSVDITSALPAALEAAETVVFALPTPAVPAVLAELRGVLPASANILSAGKGLRPHAGHPKPGQGSGGAAPPTPLGHIKAALPELDDSRLAVLAGPFLATEIAANLPATLVVGATHPTTASSLAESFTTPNTRVVTSTDRQGVELLAGLKTVFAIGAGLVEGIGLGEGARACLLVTLYQEVNALCQAFAVHPQTLTGLAGLGEIILHGTAPRSRAWQVGYLVGRGTGLEPGLRTRPSTTSESLETLEVAAALAAEHGIAAPGIGVLCEAVTGDLPGLEGLYRLVGPGVRSRPAGPFPPIGGAL